MILPFTKMSGAGNDFIFIGPDHSSLIEKADMLAIRLCPRRRSIGADGLVIVERGENLRMHYYNRDGSRAGFCGNAARCFVVYCLVKGIASGCIEFMSDSGFHIGRATPKGAKVSMPMPRVVRELKVETGYGDFALSHIDAGVPHAVILVEGLDLVDVEGIGKAIRYHPDFSPGGTNVDFVELVGRGKAKIRTYERGVEGETLACGSGCAATGVLIAKMQDVERIELEVASGDLLCVEIDRSNNLVHLEGPAAIVYEGQVEVGD